MRTGLVVLVLVAACGGGGDGPARRAGPSPSPGTPPGRLVVVTHTTGFRHDSIPSAENALRLIGEESGLFQTEFCRTADDVRRQLAPAALARVDAVFFANTTGDLGIPDLDGFLAWIAGGGGFLGTHSASDTYRGSPGYLEMLGGEVVTHGTIVEAEVRVDGTAHPAVAHLAPRFNITDEWYRLTSHGGERTVLLSLDRNPPDGVGAAGEAVDLPLAWQKPFGAGRVFYTALGHRAEVWDDPRFRRHLREAVRWAIRR